MCCVEIFFSDVIKYFHVLKYFQVPPSHQQLLICYKMPPPPPRSSLPVKTSRPSSRNSVAAEKMISSSSVSARSNRTLPPRPAMAPQPSGRVASSKPSSGRVLLSRYCLLIGQDTVLSLVQILSSNTSLYLRLAAQHLQQDVPGEVRPRQV